MCINDIFNIVKTNPESLYIVNVAGWNPKKLVVYFFDVLLFNPDPVIFNFKEQVISIIDRMNRY